MMQLSDMMGMQDCKVIKKINKTAPNLFIKRRKTNFFSHQISFEMNDSQNQIIFLHKKRQGSKIAAPNKTMDRDQNFSRSNFRRLYAAMPTTH
jgi:hypothetical protein